MAETIAKRRTYPPQRARKNPPHLSLRDLRERDGLTLAAISKRVEEMHGMTVTVGALSAIESGTRGASEPMLHALEDAYRLRRGALTTDYTPRSRDVEPVGVAS